MITYQEWLQELIPFTGSTLLTREQYYKKHCTQSSPLQLYNFLVENVNNA